MVVNKRQIILIITWIISVECVGMASSRVWVLGQIVLDPWALLS